MKIGTRTFSVLTFTVKRSREIRWFHFPLYCLRNRGESPASCLWIITLGPPGKLVVTFRSQPAEQPTSGSLVIQGGEVPGSTNLDLLGEGLISQEQHSQQAVVGGGSKLRAGKREEWVTPLMWSGYSKHSESEQALPSPTTLTTVQQPLCVGYWVTGQKGFRSEGEDIASI